MSDQSKDTSISHANTPAKDTVDEQAKVAISTSGEPETPVNALLERTMHHDSSYRGWGINE